MYDKDLHIIVEYIKKVGDNIKDDVGVRTNHQYSLRRRLLSCPYYHDHFFFRFLSRIGMHRREFRRLFGVMFLFVAVGISGYVLVGVVFTKPSIEIEKLSDVKSFSSDFFEKEYLQDLYRYGYINFSHIDSTGNRVYQVRNVSAFTDIIDSTPYKIDLVISQ